MTFEHTHAFKQNVKRYYNADQSAACWFQNPIQA